jgi:hypothetical protein
MWLLGLFLFLLAYGVSTAWIVNKEKKTLRPGRLASLYMALQVVRMLIFLGVVFIYMVAVKIETKRFLLVAIMMYGLYVLIITVYVTMTEKRLKKQ